MSIKTPLEWAREACRTIMQQYSAAQLPPANRWHYHQGVFLYGMQKLWEQTGEAEYFSYIKSYVDHLVDEQGNFYFDRAELDAIQAGLLLFMLEEQTGKNKYRKAADKLRGLFYTLNRTSEGGFWHKDIYPYQMWLDGLYMGGVFAMIYGRNYEQPGLIEMALQQERLLRQHTKDEQTGLYYHAWDESRETPWSDPNTGKAPEFWGRAIGWYGMALNDFLDILPEHHPNKPELQHVLQQLAAAYAKYQDKQTGLWYQVVDQGDRADNWLETSCSSLFTLTLAKAINNGHIEQKYKETALKGYNGLLTQLYFDEQDSLRMPGICIGTGVGDYSHYINRPTSENDLHGIGSFVMACVEIQRLVN